MKVYLLHVTSNCCLLYFLTMSKIIFHRMYLGIQEGVNEGEICCVFIFSNSYSLDCGCMQSATLNLIWVLNAMGV